MFLSPLWGWFYKHNHNVNYPVTWRESICTFVNDAFKMSCFFQGDAPPNDVNIVQDCL